MNHEFNLENVKKLVYSDSVPDNDEDGLGFYVDGIYVRIMKPYFENGENLGEFIYIEDEEEELGITIAIAEEEPEGMEISYKTRNSEDFYVLEDISPQYIKDFFAEIWVKILIAYDEEKIFQQKSKNTSQLLFEDFEEMFSNHQVPKDLKQLFEFEKESESECYSECFYLTIRNKSGVEIWCKDKAFSDAFIEFACANGSGSFYAIWLTESNIEYCPIIVFGDEGGIHVVANSIKELIQLLTYDTEIRVNHEDVNFYRDEEEYEHTEYHEEFTEWVKKEFDLDEIETEDKVMEIVNNAQAKYQTQLNDFLTKFGIEI